MNNKVDFTLSQRINLVFNDVFENKELQFLAASDAKAIFYNQLTILKAIERDHNLKITHDNFNTMSGKIAISNKLYGLLFASFVISNKPTSYYDLKNLYVSILKILTDPNIVITTNREYFLNYEFIKEHKRGISYENIMGQMLK
jgi:hypothetical protein